MKSRSSTAQAGSVSTLGNSAMDLPTAGIAVTRISTGGSIRNFQDSMPIDK